MANLFTVTPHTAIDHIITLDQFNTGNLIANAAHQFPAGKGVNVAKTITSMKTRVTALGFIGQQSAELFQQLDSTLLTTDFSQVPGLVRQNITLQTRSIDQETHIRTPGFTVTEKDTNALINKINANIQPDDIVILSGSLPQGCNAHFYADIITHCHKKNARILLDSSGQSLANSIKATPYLIKPNLIEMEALVGYPLTHTTAIINAAQHFIHQGIQVVIVSLGKDGIIAVTQTDAVQLRCDKLPNQELINTLGCGDALMGGLALAYQQNKSFPEALKLGISCATANLFSQEPGRISPQLVNEITAMVRFNSVKNP
jgi:1-phosphofructokinase family hexose kinase